MHADTHFNLCSCVLSRSVWQWCFIPFEAVYAAWLKFDETEPVNERERKRERKKERKRNRETHCGKRIRCVRVCMCQPVKMFSSRNHTEYSMSEWSGGICVMRTGLPGRRSGVRQRRKWEHARLTSNYWNVSLVMLGGRSSSDVAADPTEPRCPRVRASVGLSVSMSRACVVFQKQEVRDWQRPYKGLTRIRLPSSFARVVFFSD